MKHFIRIAFISLLATALPACNGTGAAGAPGAPARDGGSRLFPQVASTISEIKVVSVRDRALEDGTTQVAIAFENVAVYAVSAALSVTWFDVNDFPIKTTLSNWKEFELASGEMRELVVTGPGQQASRYSIAFRKSR